MSVQRRASVSRRSSLRNNMGSPGVRSRSAERSGTMSDRELEFRNSFLLDDDKAELLNNVDSERATEKNDHKGHKRAMSDPFDTAEIGGITDGAVQLFTDSSTEAEEEPVVEPSPDDSSLQPLPTLPRYPVMETRDKNCWSEPPVSIFHVRGEDYMKSKKKIVSAPYLFRARGCDLFLADNPQQCVIGENVNGVLGGGLRQQHSFLVRLTFPWGLLIQYFEIPQKLVPYLQPGCCLPIDDSFSPAERTLARWFMGDDEYKNERLKLIPFVAEGPWVVRNLVTGKPALIGKKLPVSYKFTPALGKHCCFLECDLDIGNSSKTAKNIVSVCRRYMNALTVDIGFVIQGNEEDELPEQMLGSIRIHGVEPLLAPSVG